MSENINLTTNVTLQKVFTTDEESSGISLMIPSGDSLGGGTLTLLIRPARQDTQEYLLDTLALDAQDNYYIGADMDVFLTLAGAIAPDVNILIGDLA